MEIKISSKIFPTENKMKLVGVMKTTFPGCIFSISKDKIECITKDQNVLSVLKETIDKKRIRHTVHYLIVKNQTSSGTKLELNKQTLVLGKINFVEESYPLGNVVIETDIPQELLTYFTN